jgi:hypothetical protein
MTSKLTQAGLAAAAALAIVAGAEARQAPAPAGAPTKQDHVVALKQSLQDGQAKIRQYGGWRPRSSA